MRTTINASVCPVRYCGRLVCAALPLIVLPPFKFDTKTYCSPLCADLHSRGDCRTPSGPLITCEVCCEDRPLTDYIHQNREHDVITEKWNLPVPSYCLSHLAPKLLNMEGGTCMDCLRSHILTQLETRGAINISCIQSHLTIQTSRGLPTTEHIRLVKTHEWLPYAHHFIPQDLHDLFHQQLFEHFIHSTTATVWTCPSECGFSNGILQPHDTPGFPHVECPGCHEHFCTNCKVPWHDKQTCQQYRAQHPELRDKDEVNQLHEMARLGARRCPRCQFIIVKDGGCDHVHCEQCRFDFIFPEAERVVAPPPDYVPAPVNSASSSSFRGWAKLRHVQEEYIKHNRVADTPFDISSAITQQEEDIFYHDPETNLWTPEICELDAIAGRAAGRRYVRQPSRDRDDFMAFVAVEGGEQGGVTLDQALMSHLRPFVHVNLGGRTPFEATNNEVMDALGVNNRFMEMMNQQFALLGDRDDAAWPPFQAAIQGGHTNDPNPAAPAPTVFDPLMNNRSVQEAAERGDADENNADDNGIQDEGENRRQPHVPFVSPWEPRDAIEALVDQMLFGTLLPGVDRFIFGNGLEMPPIHMFEGGEGVDGAESP